MGTACECLLTDIFIYISGDISTFLKFWEGGNHLLGPPLIAFLKISEGGYLLLGPPLIAFSKKKFILSIFNMHFLLKYLTYSHHLATKIMPLLSSTSNDLLSTCESPESY